MNPQKELLWGLWVGEVQGLEFAAPLGLEFTG